MNSSVFVTSTGTDIGKTVVSGLLMDQFMETFDSSRYLKPVASGCGDSDWGYRSPDEVDIIEQTGLKPVSVESHSRFQAPLSPDKAAEKEGKSIDYDDVLHWTRQMISEGESSVVEGIGGVAVPLTQNHDVSDLAADLSLPTLVVVSSRLGTISHTRTAMHYLDEKEIPVIGIVLTPETGEDIEQLNRQHLSQLYPDIPVELMPELSSAAIRNQARGSLETNILQGLF